MRQHGLPGAAGASGSRVDVVISVEGEACAPGACGLRAGRSSTAMGGGPLLPHVEGA